MTDYVYYVNPGSTTGGDGTADTLSGSTRAYESLAAAISARSGVGSSGDSITFRCSGTTGAWVDTAPVTVTGFTSGVSVIIEGYNGNYTGRQLGDAYDNTDCYALEISTSSQTPIKIQNDNVTVRYLQVDSLTNNNAWNTVSHISGSSFLCDSCRIRATKQSTSYYGIGIQLTIGGSIKNCTVEGNGHSNGTHIGIYATSGAVVSIVSNTVYNFATGIRTQSSDTAEIRNNVIANCGNDWYLTPSSGTYGYNADSNDGDTPGSNNQVLSTTLTDEFTDPSSGNFTVASDGASNHLHDTGTSGGTIPTVDIVGTSRSSYSIGAYEYVAGGGVPTLSSPGVINVQSDRATPQVTLTF